MTEPVRFASLGRPLTPSDQGVACESAFGSPSGCRLQDRGRMGERPEFRRLDGHPGLQETVWRHTCANRGDES
jgi:hypothetical protein